MITGETEALMSGHLYDDFLFGDKATRLERKRLRKARRSQDRLEKKAQRLKRSELRLSSPVRELKRQRRKNFLMDLGDVYKNFGGATGIGQRIDSIAGPTPNYANVQDSTASDYQIKLGQSDVSAKEAKGIPTAAYVVGGVLAVGIIGLVAMKKRTPEY